MREEWRDGTAGEIGVTKDGARERGRRKGRKNTRKDEKLKGECENG